MKNYLLFICLIATTLAADSANSEGVILRAEGSVDLDDDVKLMWKVWENDTLDVEFSAKTTGWVGVGFGAESDTESGDFYYSNGTAVVDANGTAGGQFTQDTTQNVSDVSVTDAAGIKTMKFTRNLDTGDDNDFKFIPGEDIPALWAYGNGTFDYANSTKKSYTDFPITEKAFSMGVHEVTSGRIVRYRAYDDGTDKHMVFEFTAPTTGWMGLGFGVSETMIDADLVYYAASTAGGARTLVDAKGGDKNGPPTTDASQDVTFLKFTSGTNTATIRFTRKFDTGDEDDYVIPSTGKLEMIWACNHGDVLDYHGIPHRGSIEFDLGGDEKESGSFRSSLVLPTAVLTFLLLAFAF